MFEDKFPSLTECNSPYWVKTDGDGNTYISYLNYTEPNSKWYAETDIEDNCLDKQKVKEAILKYSYEADPNAILYIFKALGIDQ